VAAYANVLKNYIMKCVKLLLICQLFIAMTVHAQQYNADPFIAQEDLSFLEGMTRDVLEASRIYPGQFISKDFGANNTGGMLIRPGGRDAYPSFWIRDYAMSLETGFVSKKEQQHMLLLTASTQCDQAWITKGGSLIPTGAIADHIRIDNGKPIYFPGTYSYEEQGIEMWGTLPPYCDQFFFIHMAYYYVKNTGDRKILLKEINGTRLIDRLKAAFHMPAENKDNHMVFASEGIRGVDFGFRDAIKITGNLSFASILKFRAANELAILLQLLKSRETEQYSAMAIKIKQALPGLFMDKRGMLLASTGKSSQPDVWATALAVYLGMLEGEDLEKACRFLTTAYKAGTLSYKGNIRHILTTDDFDQHTAWEFSGAPLNTYQNGAYWGTPTGWVCYAIYKNDKQAAKNLAIEFIVDLKTQDYRKGGELAAPYECFNQSDYRQNPLYLTTVACPLVAFRKILGVNQ
jgi:hypothetical protein